MGFKLFKLLMNEEGGSLLSGSGSSDDSGSSSAGSNSTEQDETSSTNTAAEGGTNTHSDFSFPENWTEHLSEDIRSEKSLGHIKTINDLAKSYVHAQKSIGKDKIIVPDEFSGDEDWNALYDKLGRPSSPDKYDIRLEEDSKLDEATVNDIKGMAHKLGLNSKQAQQLISEMDSITATKLKESEEAYKQNFDKSVENLQKEWGKAFDKNLGNAQFVVRSFGDDNFVKFLDESGMGNNPEVIRFLSKIGNELGEDSIKGNPVDHKAMTPTEARTKVNEIMGNTKHPYHIKEHPSHNDAVAEVSKLFNYIV